jgi:hypothetical protein
MRSYWAIAALIALCVQLSAQHALAVGYVRYPAGHAPANQTRTCPQIKEGLSDMLSEASARSSMLLDEVASSVKSILGQFGLKRTERP